MALIPKNLHQVLEKGAATRRSPAPQSMREQWVASLCSVDVTSADKSHGGSSPSVDSKRRDRDPVPSRPAPPVPPIQAIGQPVNQSGSRPLPPRPTFSAPGVREVDSKYRGPSQGDSSRTEAPRRSGGFSQPSHVPFGALAQQANQARIGLPLSDMLSSNTRSQTSHGDDVQLFQLEQRLRAQADQLRETADQLAALRSRRASMVRSVA
jgi:hypothetical protein